MTISATEHDADGSADRAAFWSEHRKNLVLADQKAQEDFDKTVISLSGGALGISFVFLKDVIGSNPIQAPSLLLVAWVAWGASTLFVLTSYFCSHMAIRRMIKQIDTDVIHKEKQGGHWRDATATLNILGAVLFVGGVLAITLFAAQNLSAKGVVTNDSAKATGSAPTSAASSNSSASAAAASSSSSTSSPAAPGSAPSTAPPVHR